MWDLELILFVLLILIVIAFFHSFGLLEQNGKTTQIKGSASSREYGLNRRSIYSDISDEELDNRIRNITQGNPLLGQRNVMGQLLADGLQVQRDRVAEALVRVDAAAVAMRWSQTIYRRTYSVPGPNALWHIDGNHKLISDESDSKEQNNMTDCTEIASDEYSDDGEEIDPAEEQNIFREFVDENILNTYMEHQGVLRGLMKYIKENIDNWKKRKLNIAIIGNSGTGKSSLINAVRGLKPSDDKAASVGVTETTTERRKYEFPNNENIILWDLPGVGTQQFRRDEYLEKNDIRGFDAFIIVSASRFTENEIWLAEEILRRKNFIFFVRTKVDIDLMNDKRDHPETFDEERCLESMRMEIRKNLLKANIPMPKAGIFLVSSVEKDNHDFQAMFEKLRDLLNSKGVSVQKLLQKYVEKVVMKEREDRKYIYVVDHVLSLVHPLCVASQRFTERYRIYKKGFCLDDKTLQEVSEEINISVEDLKERQLNFFKNVENNHRYFPVSLSDICSSLKGHRSYSIFEKIFQKYHIFKSKLHDVCDILAEDEVTLIKLRLSRLVEQLTPL